MTDDLQQIIEQAAQSIAEAKRPYDLEQLRSTLLGKKSALNEYLKKLAQLPAAEKPKLGQAVNQAKQQIEALLKAQSELLVNQEINAQLNREKVDITLVGRGQTIGSSHPVTRTRERIERFFTHAGFTVEQGPEIEDDYHNFEALNISSNHPARALHDTFYLAEGLLLRTHTSTVQIRAMRDTKPPIKMIAPGRVYRCDSDITHTPMFHQVEGLLIDESANFSELKGLLIQFLQQFFEKKDLLIRFRASYFPFTEPSAEVDIMGENGWLEVLGCGMVHPKVLENVGIDSSRYTGLAFGMGVERLAMLRYGIDDLRIFFENDLRFLKQFN